MSVLECYVAAALAAAVHMPPLCVRGASSVLGDRAHSWPMCPCARLLCWPSGVGCFGFSAFALAYRYPTTVMRAQLDITPIQPAPRDCLHRMHVHVCFIHLLVNLVGIIYFVRMEVAVVGVYFQNRIVKMQGWGLGQVVCCYALFMYV